MTPDPDDDLAELEDFLAGEWDALRPIDGDDLDRTVDELVDICYLLKPVDVDNLYAAAEAKKLGDVAGVLGVLAGLAKHLRDD